jgi:flagellar hook assembly protein FlgD
MLGRKIRKLVDDNLAAGQHSITWDGRTDAGELLPSGIYFCHFKSSETEETRRLLLLK